MDDSNCYYTYQLRIEDEPLPFYVGKGRGNRAWEHLSPYRQDTSHKSNKISKAQNQGRNILVEFLEVDLCEFDAHLWEVFYISLYGRADKGIGCLTNKTDGGEGVSGYTFSAEARKRMSEQRAGENSPWFGRNHSEQSRRKLSEANLGENHPMFGKTYSDEVRSKMSESRLGDRNHRYGIIPTDETRSKIADANSKTWIVTHPDGTEETVKNVEKFCREHNLHASSLRDVAKGKATQHKGYKCRKP